MWREAIVAYVRDQALPVEKYSHQPRLYHIARQVGAGLTYNDDALFAAAWLHDIGVFVGHRPDDAEALARWDNVAYALSVVPAILERVGFPMETLPLVHDAIANHLPARTPGTVEGIILRDADILEQLGAVGMLRTVCKIGRDTRFTVFPDALQSLRRAVETLPPLLTLETARRMAMPRVAVLQTFLAAVETEADGAPL